MTRPDPGLTAAALLPTPVRVVWVLVMIVLLALFVRCALTASGSRRLWYAVYGLIACGMGVMFALSPMVAVAPSGIAVLVVAGIVAIGLAGWMVAHRDDEGFSLPWVFALADLVVVAYIQVPSPSRPVLVCSAMAAYLAVQVVARAIGAFRARPEPDLAAPVSGLVGATVGPGLDPARPQGAATSRPSRGWGQRADDAARDGLSGRLDRPRRTVGADPGDVLHDLDLTPAGPVFTAGE